MAFLISHLLNNLIGIGKDIRDFPARRVKFIVSTNVLSSHQTLV